MLQLQQEKIHPQRLFYFAFSYLAVFFLFVCAYILIYLDNVSAQILEYFQITLISIFFIVAFFNFYKFLVLAKQVFLDKMLFHRVDLSIGQRHRISPQIIKVVLKATILGGVIANGVITLSMPFYFVPLLYKP